VESIPLWAEDSHHAEEQAPVPRRLPREDHRPGRSGRATRSLAREFKVTDTTIRSWVRQADLDTCRRSDGLTTDEELVRAASKRHLVEEAFENANGRWASITTRCAPGAAGTTT
jgi:transposase-like protein